MDTNKLETIAQQLVAEGKGLVAADESNNSCKKRFDAVGLECTAETRRQYRQILITANSINKYVSGIILFDETFWQITDASIGFVDHLEDNGILPGIKVDKGLIELPGFDKEKITQGLDGLVERMENYAHGGAKFAKWRALLTIGNNLPSDACIDANAYVLARYARICQQFNIVPLIEPEILFDGKHSIEQCDQVMRKVFSMTMDLLKHYKVYLPGMILKTSMVLPGKDSGNAIDHSDVAHRTASVLKDSWPAELGGVVFLSGGQTPNDAFINLNRIKQNGPFNWGVTFSFSRAIQDPVLKLWAKSQDAAAAAEVYSRQLQLAAQASLGQLDENINIDNFVSGSQDL